MATPVVTAPVVSAPPSAPPAAPVATPAPAAPVSTTPTPTPTPAEPLSLGERISQGWEKAKGQVNLEDGTVTPPPAEVAPPEVSDEVVNPEIKTDPVAPLAEGEEEFKLNLGEEEAPAPDDFAKSLKPEHQAFFDANPELKGQVFGALRRDAENREIRQLIPDVDTAKVYSKAAGQWQTIDNHFLDAATAEKGPETFLNHWVKEALIIGDDGKPLLDADGKYQVHPSLPKILDHISNNKLKIYADAVGKSGTLPQEFSPIVDALGKVAALKGDERLQAAVDVIREVMTPSSPAEGEVPDNLKPFVTSLKAKEEALNKREKEAARRDSEGRETAHFESIDRAEIAAATLVQGQLKPLLAKSGLSEKMQGWALRDIGDGLNEALGTKTPEGNWEGGSNPIAKVFQSTYDNILRQAPGEAREKALKSHILKYTNEVIGSIYAAVTKDAAKPTLDGQTDRLSKVDGQVNATKTEPRGTSAAPAPPSNQRLTDTQLRTQITEAYKKDHNGEMPDREYLIREGWAFRTKEAARLAGVK